MLQNLTITNKSYTKRKLEQKFCIKRKFVENFKIFFFLIF